MASRADGGETREPPAQRAGKHTILFLAANPLGTTRLALDEEARAIEHELERSSWRDCFELVTRWAAQPMDLLRELRKLKPTIVHFSGHGSHGPRRKRTRSARTRDATDPRGVTAGEHHGGLFFQAPDGRAALVSTDALKTTFEAAGASVKVVVLSACFSEPQAEALLAHVRCIVGMRGPIRDADAKTFAIGFYGGLAERESVGVAFKQGVAALHLTGMSNGFESDDLTPRRIVPPAPVTQLLTQSCIDPAKLYLHEERRTTRRCSIVIKANLKDFDPEAIARVRDQLRELRGDWALEIVEVEEGSVRLTVSLSPAAAQRLKTLRDDGSLVEICGFPISSIQVQDGHHGEEQEPSKSDLDTAVSIAAREVVSHSDRQLEIQRVGDRIAAIYQTSSDEQHQTSTAIMREATTGTDHAAGTSTARPRQSRLVSESSPSPGLSARAVETVEPRPVPVPGRARSEFPAGDANTVIAELVTAHGDAIYSLCLRVLRDRTLVHDVLQQVFLEAHRDLQRVEGRLPLRSWLFGIAAHRCQDAIKASRRRSSWLRNDDDSVILDEDPAASPHGQLERQRQLADLDRCVAKLSYDSRLAVLLRFQGGMAFDEMAVKLGVKADTLQRRVQRALPVLKRCLEQKGWSI